MSAHRRTFSRGLSALSAGLPLSRPGIPSPGGSAPFLGAPIAGNPRRIQAKPLRRSLRICLIEGIFAEVVTACAGGAVLTGWALHLGCKALVIGLIASLPQIAQLVQLPAAWTTALLGHRRACLWLVGLSRQALLPMIALPFLPVPDPVKQALLVTVALSSAVLGVLGNNAWVAWMGELVPRRIRGRYFGRRTGLCMLGGAVASAAAGAVLDHAHGRDRVGLTLAGLALVACAAGAVTTWLMRQQHDPAAGAPRAPFDLRQALRPFGDPSAQGLLRYQLVWNFAVGLAGSFFSLHMLKNLGMGFTLVAIYGAATAALRMVTAPLWGRLIDRFGARPVLVFCSFSVSVIPLFWLLPTRSVLWPVALDALFSGPLWGGHGLAVFALPLAIAPRDGRPWYLAAFAAVGGITFSVATVLAGALAQQLPHTFSIAGHTFWNLQVLFVASSIARLGAAGFALRIVEPSARPVTELVRALPAALLPSHAGSGPRRPVPVHPRDVT
ncbi:MAG: MFS transporter [Myxococcaceae bacterium]|nr:MFS transporter [Myxococcaceae bacterium]